MKIANLIVEDKEEISNQVIWGSARHQFKKLACDMILVFGDGRLKHFPKNTEFSNVLAAAQKISGEDTHIHYQCAANTYPQLTPADCLCSDILI